MIMFACYFFLLSTLLLSATTTTTQAFSLFGGSKKDVPTVVYTEIEGIRGVLPNQQAKYEGQESFVCDNGAKSLAKAALNDNYCDCVDGTDEPGTSACAQNTFHCVNKGYRIIQIPSSRVDDLTCDCCDGSDEVWAEGTGVKCPNTCAAAAEKESEMLNKVTNAYRVGSVKRATDIESIKLTKAEAVARAEPLKKNVEQLREAVRVLDEEKASLSKRNEEDAADMKRQAQDSLEFLLNVHQEALTEEYLASMLSASRYLFDMDATALRNVAVSNGIPIRKVVHHRRAGDDGGEEEEDDVDDAEDAEDEDREESNTLDCSFAEIVGDPALSVFCDPHGRGPEAGNVIVQDAMDTAREVLLQIIKEKKSYREMMLLMGYYKIKNSFSGAVDFARAQLSNAGGNEGSEANTCPASFARVKHHDGSDICELADKFSEIHGQMEQHADKPFEKEQELRETRDRLRAVEGDYTVGADAAKELEEYADKLEYLALKDKCVEGKDGKFIYTVCMLKSVTQKDTESQSTVRLGSFASIDKEDSTGGAVMHFDEGDHCWNHGARKADVHVTCGAEDKVVSATEPSTCFYTFELESPAGCSAQFASIHGLEATA